MTSPVQEIVAGLNEVQPTMLGGYPSGLYPLVHEARAGRLRIRPKRIWVGAEPLLPEIRLALEETFGAPVRNGYGSSEVAIRCTGPIDLAALRAEIAEKLEYLALEAPDVAVVPVERLERQVTGKLKRFVPLAAAG